MNNFQFVIMVFTLAIFITFASIGQAQAGSNDILSNANVTDGCVSCTPRTPN